MKQILVAFSAFCLVGCGNVGAQVLGAPSDDTVKEQIEIGVSFKDIITASVTDIEFACHISKGLGGQTLPNRMYLYEADISVYKNGVFNSRLSDLESDSSLHGVVKDESSGQWRYIKMPKASTTNCEA
ncbi:MAG: hypothetical protein AAF650_10165 [Pseudomonadota bacterium]